mgnify:CR=1 FL=1
MRINVEYSTQHWIFPIITIGILVILGALLIALEGRARNIPSSWPCTA